MMTLGTQTLQADPAKRRRRLAGLASSVSVIALGLPAAALAQNAVSLEEVVVTAQKRSQRLQEVPVAVTALTADTLTANRIVSVRDLGTVVPNLQVRTVVGGNNLPGYTMRGLFTLGSAPGTDKGVAIYVDGVYLGAFGGSIFELAEIERVEVLRGPQGTLFGRNSTGGAISFITREPSGEFGAKLTGTVGNYDQLRFSGRVDLPQVGPFSASLTYLHSERRGDLRNLGAGAVWDFTRAFGRPQTYTSPKWLGGDNIEAFGAAVKLEPTDDFKAIYRFDYSKDQMTAPGMGVLYMPPFIRALLPSQPNQAVIPTIEPTRPDAVNNRAVVPSWTKAYGHSLTMEYQLAENVSLKNIAAYRWTSWNSRWQEIMGIGGLVNTGGIPFLTIAALPFFQGGPALINSTIGQPLQVQATTTAGDDAQWSDELQLNLDTDFVTLTAGGLYYETKLHRSTIGEEGVDLGFARSGLFRIYPNFQVPFQPQTTGWGGRETTLKMRSYALYGYGEFHVTDSFDVVAGIRWTKDRKKGTDFTGFSAATPVILAVDYRDDRFTYNLGVNYKVNEDVLVYGKYSTGFISGGALGSITFLPETAKSWEGGLKADWLNHTLRTNLAIFSVEYGAIQIPVGGVNFVPPRPEITQAAANAGDARAKGFELETTYVPFRGLTLSAGLGYTDFKYTQLLPLVLAGNVDYLETLRPEWTGTISAQYRSDPLFDDVILNVRIDGSYKSEQWGIPGLPATSALFPAAEQTLYKAISKIPPYWIFNARIALEGFRISGADATLALWSRNLFDVKQPNSLQSISFFSIAADYERARTVGVDLTVEF
jgi:iron complex outermembrane receptor protein